MRKKKKHSKTQDLILLKDALSNYKQRNYEACKAALKQIPFRSPYRDCTTIIKGLILIETDASLQLFNKIPEDSPYKKLATVISLSTNSIESLISSKPNSDELALIASLKGWNDKQINMINKVIKPQSNKVLLELVIKNWQFFGKEKSRQFCLALLPHYPTGIKIYEREFGSLSSFEKNRILALSSEQDEADKYWRKCIKYLKQEQNNELKIAFIYRHLVELAHNKENIISDLEASLLYDPADKNTYLKLAKWYEHKGELKSYHKWVDTALKHLPKDPDILLLGMASATRKKAFKKAVKYAQTLLKIDPINAKARDCAVASHISHAHKLIKTKKYTLASKELEKVNKPNDIVQINQALLALHTSDNQATAIKMLLEKDGICDRFRVIVESKRQFLDLKLSKANITPTKNNALKLLNIINAYLAEKVDCLSESVEEIKATIIKMAKLDFSQNEMLSLCECFKNLANYNLLTKFATEANKRWLNHPAFMFYQVYGEIHGKIFNLDGNKFHIIDKAIEIANNQGDKRTAMMIINFMKKYDNSL